MENEIWYDIPRYEGLYQISNLNRVKALSKTRASKNNSIAVSREKIIKIRVSAWGYKCFTATNNGNVKVIFIHKILAQLFIPNPENKPQVNHINGIKTDNRVENLEWVTREENLKHATDILKCQEGESNGNSKLKKEDIMYIRANYVPYKMTRRKLGEKFGVTKEMIDKIIQNNNWVCV